MTIGLRGIAKARNCAGWRRWLKRNVLAATVDGWRGFASPFVHRPMLLDKIRPATPTAKPFSRTVNLAMWSWDLGAGTGLLSFFALQAGARQLYAMEMTGIADAARELIEGQRISRIAITLVRKSSLKARLPERCDVLVTETLSTFCFDTETPSRFVADARQRFLKPGGPHAFPNPRTHFSCLFLGSFPASANCRLACTISITGHSSRGSPRIPSSARFRQTVRGSQRAGALLPRGFRKDRQNPGKTFAPFRIIADGRLDGFLGWFEARLCQGVTLSNSPRLPLTELVATLSSRGPSSRTTAPAKPCFSTSTPASPTAKRNGSTRANSYAR